MSKKNPRDVTRPTEQRATPSIDAWAEQFRKGTLPKQTLEEIVAEFRRKLQDRRTRDDAIEQLKKFTK